MKRFLRLVVVLVSLAVAGCSSTGARQALVMASDAIKIAHERTSDICGELAADGCKTNPCPALVKCQKARRYINAGGRALAGGLKLVNELVDDGGTNE